MSYRFAGGEVFGFQRLAVGGQDEFCLGGGGFGAVAQGLSGFGDFAGLACGYVDVVALEHAVGQVRGVGFAFAQALDGGFFVAERGWKGERELGGVEVLAGEIRIRLFDGAGTVDEDVD